MKLDIKGYPTILKIVCAIVLLPILAAPLVLYGSIFVFDDPNADTFIQYAVFIGLNSYSFLLFGICVLSVYLYTKYHKYIISVLPYLLFLLIAGAIWFCKDGPIDKDKVLPSDYRLFRDTPCETLAKAVDRQDTDLIESILLENPGLADYKESKFGQCVLFQAVVNNRIMSVETLLRNGTNPNMLAAEKTVQPSHPFTALTYLSEDWNITDNDYIDIVRLLVEYGADIDATNCNFIGHIWNFPIRPLSYKAENGNLNVVKFLLEIGANPNMPDYNGFLPLKTAFINNNYDIMLELLKSGADPDLQSPHEEFSIREELVSAINGTSKTHYSDIEIQEFRKLFNYITSMDSIPTNH